MLYIVLSNCRVSSDSSMDDKDPADKKDKGGTKSSDSSMDDKDEL